MSETSTTGSRGGPNIPLPSPAGGLGASAMAPPESDARGRDEEDPRVRAEKRAAEFLDHIGTLDRGVDKFYIDPRIIPPGWDYEWKTFTVWGKENPSYQVALMSNAWESVPRTRHPEMMPQNYPGNTIERDGQILMERPMKLTMMVRAQDNRRAREQVQQKEVQLGNAPEGTFERSNKEKGSMVKVNRTYEHIPIPET